MECHRPQTFILFIYHFHIILAYHPGIATLIFPTNLAQIM